jgi:hypothetical protein
LTEIANLCQSVPEIAQLSPVVGLAGHAWWDHQAAQTGVLLIRMASHAQQIFDIVLNIETEKYSNVSSFVIFSVNNLNYLHFVKLILYDLIRQIDGVGASRVLRTFYI